MRKLLVDADAILELFINRSGFVEDIEKLLEETKKTTKVELYITDKCLKRVLLEFDEADSKVAEDSVAFIKKNFNDRIITINSILKKKARKYLFPDFDSAEEVCCAIEESLDGIVTHNPSNFGLICEYGVSKLKIWELEIIVFRLSLEEVILQISQPTLNESPLQKNVNLIKNESNRRENSVEYSECEKGSKMPKWLIDYERCKRIYSKNTGGMNNYRLSGMINTLSK